MAGSGSIRVSEPLTETEKAMLDLARERYKYPAAREQHARERFGLTATQYWQRVNRLIDTREALEYSPPLVLALRARRERASRGVKASCIAPIVLATPTMIRTGAI